MERLTTILLMILFLLIFYMNFFEIENKKNATNNLETQQIKTADGGISNKQTTRFVVMVMGQEKYLPKWTWIIGSIDVEDAEISIIYGSYDTNPKNCNGTVTSEESSVIGCNSIFIPNTTWTEGRNLLAAEAIRKERIEQRKYDWWVFIDDDFLVRCDPDVVRDPGQQYENNIFSITGQGMCWEYIVKHLHTNHFPETITSAWAWANDYAPKDSWKMIGPVHPLYKSISTSDAMITILRREYIPYLLPYATLEKQTSEWISAAVSFCIIQECFPSSVYCIPHTTAMNELHRAYEKRNFDLKHIQDTIQKNLYNNTAQFFPCQEMTSMEEDFGQFLGVVEAESLEDLNDMIPIPKLDHCQPLVHRYSNWVKTILP